jgi:hypothetical protein
MGADDAWSAEIKRLPFTPDPDPLALDDDLADRLLDGDLPPDQTPPGYAEVAALLAAAAAPPTPAELAGQEAALAELLAVARARRAIPRGTGRPGRRRRVGLLVAVVVCGLSTTGIAVATTGTLPAPIRDTARRIFATVDDATPMPSTTPGRQPVPSTADAAAVGATSEGQRPRPAGAPGTTAGTDAVNDGPCRASKVHKGADKKLNAVTSQAPVEAAGDPDSVTSECQKSRPDGTGGNGQETHPPSNGQGREQGGESPPDAGSNPGQGQEGPPPNSGGGSPEKGRPIETGPGRTSFSTSR